MKSILTKPLLFGSFTLICSLTFGQVGDPVPEPAPKSVEPVKPQEPVIYDVVDEQAEFPGGKEALMEYLKKNLKYPESAKENGLEGKCYLQFIVSEHGYTSNVKIRKGVTDCPECDQEAIRLVKGMPKWKPGKINGKSVNSIYTLPIVFKL